MMNDMGIFSHKSDIPFIKNLNDDVTVKVVSHNEDIALLYFVNRCRGSVIVISNDITLVNFTNGNSLCNLFFLY